MPADLTPSQPSRPGWNGSRRTLATQPANPSAPEAAKQPSKRPERKTGLDAPVRLSVASRADLERTADTITACQLPDGMIPWFDEGHADPWNHVEAAMSLAALGRRAEADAAYGWLARIQRPDGAWHQYYTAHGVEQDKLDANVIAYVATGVWHHYLRFGDDGFLSEMWPVVQRALDFVLDLQTPRGEIIWARHADGTPWSFALLTGSSSISHSLRCGLAIAAQRGVQRPDWELALARLVRTIRQFDREAFAPKDRYAMDWYYPVLTGVLTGAAGRERLRQGWDRFVLEGEGVRCVSDREWVTTAETCECAMAYLSVGDRLTATRLFEWAQRLRQGDGRYLTGLALPERVSFPDQERTTYSAAAVILTADALAADSATSGLFADHAMLPTALELDPADSAATD